jgi:hypothetical protein
MLTYLIKKITNYRGVFTGRSRRKLEENSKNPYLANSCNLRWFKFDTYLVVSTPN